MQRSKTQNYNELKYVAEKGGLNKRNEESWKANLLLRGEGVMCRKHHIHTSSTKSPGGLPQYADFKANMLSTEGQSSSFRSIKVILWPNQGYNSWNSILTGRKSVFSRIILQFRSESHLGGYELRESKKSSIVTSSGAPNIILVHVSMSGEDKSSEEILIKEYSFAVTHINPGNQRGQGVHKDESSANF